MARIIYGSIITDIKGSIGGITYQKNGSGTIARLKPRKTKTNTQKQRDQQPRLKEVQRNWNELSLTNKVLWNDFASVNNKIGLDGNEKVLTGYQWFVTINQNRLLLSRSILLVPPVYEIVNPIDSISLLWDQTVLCVIPNIPIADFKQRWIIYSSFIINSSSRFDFNKTRLIRLIDDDFGGSRTIANTISSSSWNIYYKSNFPPSLGNKNFYMMVYIRAISNTSGISSLAYTTIVKFVWTGSEYEIE